PLGDGVGADGARRADRAALDPLGAGSRAAGRRREGARADHRLRARGKDMSVAELRPGLELGPSSWIEVPQGRIDTFAEAIDDRGSIHIDDRLAANGPYGTTVAHGFLTLSLLPAAC